MGEPAKGLVSGRRHEMNNPSKRASWFLTVDPDGLRYRTSPADGKPIRIDLEALLVQWDDDGLASRDSDGWHIGWDALYQMIDGGAYEDVRAAAGIPDFTDAVPRLVSAGSLTDRNFSISIAGWYSATGVQIDRLSLNGACCEITGERYLLAKPVWNLLERISAFGQRSPEERDGRSQRLAWGGIRQAALQAGARLDDFLYRTVVLAPEQLTIELRKTTASGEKVVEVSPGFEGSPRGVARTIRSAEPGSGTL